MGTKRAYRLQEFAAHTSNVNCLKIGRKSSGVMVTGGEDRRVNLFAIGKPGAILSMTGHQSPVECVTFDRDEEVVVAGAAGGTLKLWDLESAKVVRTLVGHRSNCTSVDFHPFGEFFASGSLDTNLKIWDVRRKGCIHTYKGHDRGVGVCKFSPDGKWVVSGGQDGKVRLWDLTAGKLLKQLHVHDGPVTSIEFHPNELLLATGSADRTVKFWDLEMFGMVDECVESTGVKSMLFHPDGRNLLTGTSEFLKVWGWEPSISRDAVDVSWRNLQDLSTRENKLLGASIQNSFVGVWVVDLNQCAPFSGAARGPGGGGTRDADREHRHGQTPEESAAAAVAVAADLSKARVLRSEREAGTVRDGVTTADDKEPSTSNATDGFSGRPFDPRDVKADKEDREEGNRSPMAMNLKFAAAHGIGEDPMQTTGQPPPAIVYAKPKPAPFSPVIPRRERKRDERRPGGETSSCPETRVVVPEVNEEIPEEVYEDDFVGVGAEDSLENVDEEDDDEMTRALGLGSDCIRKQSEPTPRYSQSPTKPLSATKKHTPFQSPTRASPRKSYKRDTQEEAFNLETLRSAALEADTEFIDANGGGGGDALLDSDSVSIETLAVAMARARAERARDEDAPSTAATQRSSFEHVHQTTKTPTPTKASALLRAKSPLGVDFASFVPGAFEINGTPPTPTPDEHVVLHALSGEDSEIVLDIYHSRLNALKATSRAWIKGDAKAVANLLTQNNDHSATADVLGAALDAPFGGITGNGPVSLELGSHLVPLCVALLESKHASYQDVALRFSRRVLFAFEPALAGAKSFMEGTALSGRRRGIGVDMAQEERIARAATTRVALLSHRDALVGIAQRSENTDLALKAREMLGALERLG